MTKKPYNFPSIEVINLSSLNIITCSGTWEEYEHEIDPDVWG